MQEVSHHPWEVLGCQELVGSSWCGWTQLLCLSCATRGLPVLLCGYRCGGPFWERGRFTGARERRFIPIWFIYPKTQSLVGKKMLLAQSISVQWKAHQGKNYFSFTPFLFSHHCFYDVSLYKYCPLQHIRNKHEASQKQWWLSMLHDTFRKNADLSNKHQTELRFSECV